jgi:succinate dehydrogenase hydrophobic anchor subunit
VDRDESDEGVVATGPIEPAGAVDPEPTVDDRPDDTSDDTTEDAADDAADDDHGDERGSDADDAQPWSWYVGRVTALFLAIALPIHVAVTVIGGDVGHTTLPTMVARLRNGWWVAFDWIVIVLALVHAGINLLGRLQGAALGPRTTVWAPRALLAAFVLLGVAATWVLVSFS